VEFFLLEQRKHCPEFHINIELFTYYSTEKEYWGRLNLTRTLRES